MNKNTAQKQLLDHTRKHTPRGVFLHVRTRLRLMPFEKVIPHVPDDGPVLDIGCAYGAFLHLLYFAGRRNSLFGTDIDQERIRFAQESNPAPEQIRYIPDLTGIPEGSLRAIILCVVLYLLGDQEKKDLLTSLSRYLDQNGIFLIKTINIRKRIKFFWTYLQEILAVKVLRWTKTQNTRLSFIKDLDEFCSFLESLGFCVEKHAIDQGYWYPHVLLVGKK